METVQKEREKPKQVISRINSIGSLLENLNMGIDMLESSLAGSIWMSPRPAEFPKQRPDDLSESLVPLAENLQAVIDELERLRKRIGFLNEGLEA